MSDQKDLKGLIDHLEQIVSDLHDDALSMDERMGKAENAMKEYRRFRQFFREKAFDVRTLSFKGGSAVEKPFNWKDLA